MKMSVCINLQGYYNNHVLLHNLAWLDMSEFLS